MSFANTLLNVILPNGKFLKIGTVLTGSVSVNICIRVLYQGSSLIDISRGL